MEGCDIFLLCSIVLCVLCCPYTKVEESFNMQAISDFHRFGFDNLQSFDHLEFPGVVPRTFIGALFLYLLSCPLSLLSVFSGYYIQIGSRIVLGLIGWISYLQFKKGVAWRFGSRTAQFTMILSALQFHTCFYLSRTLPNTFALNFCLHAFGFWLQGSAYKAIATLATAMILFRCDMLVLMAPLVLQLLISKEITFIKGLQLGIVVCSCALLLTVTFDSYMWKRLVWPEGVVLLFNTVQNKSSEWGVMPAHWYFSNALLKVQNVSLVWLVCGVLNVRFPAALLASTTKDEISETPAGPNYKLGYYLLPVTCFVLLYSILPHKELRFIFPALPLLTMGAAVGLDGVLPCDTTLLTYPLSLMYRSARLNVRKGGWGWFAVPAVSLIVMITLVVQLVLFSVFLSASIHNYPGGGALHSLLETHIKPQVSLREAEMWAAMGRLEESDSEGRAAAVRDALRPIFVHIDVAAAMTGVTRFGQEQLNVFGRTPTPIGNADFLNVNPDLFEWKALRDPFDLCVKRESSDALLTDIIIRRCLEGTNLLYYSKDESQQTDFSRYHWLITEHPQRGGENFRVAEEISGYHKMTLTKRGYLPELKKQLYILNNIDESQL